MKSAMILPCGERIGANEALEKVPRVVAGDLDHAAVRQEGSLHPSFPGMAQN
jgi:hypothetical protein